VRHIYTADLIHLNFSICDEAAARSGDLETKTGPGEGWRRVRFGLRSFLGHRPACVVIHVHTLQGWLAIGSSESQSRGILTVLEEKHHHSLNVI